MQRLYLSEDLASGGVRAADTVDQHVATILDQPRMRMLGLERNQFYVFLFGPGLEKALNPRPSKGHLIDNDSRLFK